MLVDDSRSNLMAGKMALSENYTVQTIPSAAKMLEALAWSKPELILLDVDMPEMDGFQAIKTLKANPQTRHIPVIFLTAMSDSENELQGLRSGAVDYIIKPFSPPLLQKRIELHMLLETQKRDLQNYNSNLEKMVEEKTRAIVKLQNKILTAMAEMVEGRDGDTGNHISNSQRYLEIIMTAVINAGLWQDQVAEWDVNLLLQSSQLHDIGKIAISDSILKKPGKLTSEEFAEMKLHVNFGVDFITRLEDDKEDIHFLRYAKIFASSHHEKWDGSGYPQRLAGEAIPLLGRMMALADVYDALTSERPYKKAFRHEEAYGIIIEGKGTHFDPALISLFEATHTMFQQML